MDDDEWIDALGKAVVIMAIGLLVLVIGLAGSAKADCTGVFETVVPRMQLRYTNNNPSHPQYALGRWNRWNVIDFSVPQEIPGKPTVPALEPEVCAVTLMAQVGITRGQIEGEAIAVWLDFTDDPERDEACESTYTDTANFGTGVRDTIGGIDVPLADRKLWWAPCSHSNYSAQTGQFFPGPNITSPTSVLRSPYSTAFVNLGLTGWKYEWRP